MEMWIIRRNRRCWSWPNRDRECELSLLKTSFPIVRQVYTRNRCKSRNRESFCLRLRKIAGHSPPFIFRRYITFSYVCTYSNDVIECFALLLLFGISKNRFSRICQRMIFHIWLVTTKQPSDNTIITHTIFFLAKLLKWGPAKKVYTYTRSNYRRAEHWCSSLLNALSLCQ